MQKKSWYTSPLFNSIVTVLISLLLSGYISSQNKQVVNQTEIENIKRIIYVEYMQDKTINKADHDRIEKKIDDIYKILINEKTK